MTQIELLERFDTSTIVTLEQRIVKNKYLYIDMWKKNDNGYSQIFLQINDLKINAQGDNKINFNINNRTDVHKCFAQIEKKSETIISDYVKKIKIDTNFKLTKIASKNTLTVGINNSDYPPSMFDTNKNKLAIDNVINNTGTCNIIIELMNIELNLGNNTAKIDVRLRLLMKNIVVPQRVKLNDAEVFVSKDNKVTEIIEQQLPEQHIDTGYEDIDTQDVSPTDADITQLNNDTSDTESCDETFIHCPNSANTRTDIPPMIAILADMFMQHNFPKTQ